MSVLDGFEVIEVPKTFSIAEVRILKNRISFNMAAASEVGYPGFVRILISRDRTQIALQPCDKYEQNAMKFFTEETASNKRLRTIPLGNKALATLIKAGMGWDMDDKMCAPGIRFSDENVIIFDLKQAYIKGKKNDDEKRLCVIPQPAVPFLTVPTQYYSREELNKPTYVIEAEWQAS